MPDHCTVSPLFSCVCVCVCVCVQVFPPSFQELPPPALDLFDLDEHFSSERVRVAQITNKCESYIHTQIANK